MTNTIFEFNYLQFTGKTDNEAVFECVKKLVLALRDLFLKNNEGVELNAKNSKIDYGLNRRDFRECSLFETSQDAFPHVDDLVLMQFTSKYCWSQRDSEKLKWLLHLTIQRTVVTAELTSNNNLCWNFPLISEFNKVYDMVKWTLFEISCRYLNFLMDNCDIRYQASQVYKKNLLEEIVGNILQRRLPIFIFKYLEKFDGIFNGTECFGLPFSHAPPLPHSLPLSYLYSCFCIVPGLDTNCDAKERRYNSGINTAGRKNSNVLYDAVTKNKFFQDFLQLASFSNITKLRHDDILMKSVIIEETFDNSRNYSFLFDVTKKVYNELREKEKWQQVPISWYPKTNQSAVKEKDGKQRKSRGKGAENAQDSTGKDMHRSKRKEKCAELPNNSVTNNGETVAPQKGSSYMAKIR